MKYKILAALLLLSVSVFFAGPEAIFVDDNGSARASEWKSLGGNFKRTGLSDNLGPEYGCVKWQFDTDGPVSASVTVSFDKRVHIASEDGKLYTLDANGILLWSYDANSPLLSAPTIGPDGTVYVGSESGKLYAVDVNGSLRWTHPTGGPIYSSPAVSGNGDNIYVCSQDGILYSLGPDGSELWNFEMDGPAQLPSATFASPAIGTDGTIYISGFYDPNLYALDPNDGSVKWACNTGDGLPFASPVIGAYGTIYQTLLYDSNLHAIEPNAGAIIWSTDLADPCSGWFEPNYAEDFGNAAGWSEPALGPDGTIYVSFDDPYLRAVDPNGNIKWVVPFGTVGGFTLAVGSNGLIYAASDDGVLYVVDANGCGVARFQTDYWLSLPVIAADNIIIVSGINDEAVLTGDVNSTVWAIKGYGCEDLNRDEIVNFFDFALLAADWLNCTDTDYPCNYDGNEPHLLGDIDEDGYVYLTDVEAMSGRWLENVKWLKLLPTPPPPPPPLPPGQASNPYPANGATGVSTLAVLSWTPGSGATSHDVYFGTNSPGTFQGNQTTTTFETGLISSTTMYYWRIDEVNIWGKTIGVVRHFTTRDGPPPPPPPP